MHNFLLGLTSIIVLGVVARWSAWRLRIPSTYMHLVERFVDDPSVRATKPTYVEASMTE